MASTHKWTSTDTAPDALKEGQLVTSYLAPESKIAEGAVRAGLLVERGTSWNQVAPMSALPAADADAIAVDVASSTSAQVISGSDLDGVIGAGVILPARDITFTFNSHSDWDATTMPVHFLDPEGKRKKEDVAIPDGGNATVYLGHACSQFLYAEMPAQTADNGVLDIGVASDGALSLSLKDYGVAIYDRVREPSDTTTVTFDDEETLSVLKSGEIAVIVEAAVVAGDRVGVRVVESGADVRGQFSKMPSEDPASLEFAPLEGAIYKTAASADGVAIVQLGMGG